MISLRSRRLVRAGKEDDALSSPARTKRLLRRLPNDWCLTLDILCLTKNIKAIEQI
jgi:hypothetical protein